MIGVIKTSPALRPRAQGCDRPSRLNVHMKKWWEHILDEITPKFEVIHQSLSLALFLYIYLFSYSYKSIHSVS